MERIEIFANLATRTLVDKNGGTLTLPNFFPGKYQFQLKLLDLDADLNLVQVRPVLRGVSAMIGPVQQPPEGGDFKLKFGAAGTASAKIGFDADAASFKAILGALPLAATYGLEEVYEVAAGTWMARFANAVLEPLQVADNLLQPETFVRVRETTQNGRIWYEIKLLQSPLAATAAFDRILARPPNVRRIRAGFTFVSGISIIRVNEIQALEVPAEYVGTFALKFSGQHTRVLSVTDGIDTISTALNDIYKVPINTRFVVTNPELHNAYVEFVGVFSGLPQPLLEVEITNPGEGELNFALNLDTAESAAALRGKSEVEGIFEVQIEVVDTEFADDPELPSRRVVLFQAPVKIGRELAWDGLAEAAPIDWLVPPSPKDYLPFSKDQVLTGQQQAYPAFLGDGAATSFVIAHNLASPVCEVIVVEIATGRMLRDNEYVVVFDNANSLTISGFATTPTADQYEALIVGVGPPSVFQAHTHVIGNVLDLQDKLDDQDSRLAVLEALLPTQLAASPSPFINPFSTGDEARAIVFIKLNEKVELVPLSRGLQGIDLTLIAKGTIPANLPKPGALLPAIHRDSVDVTLGVPNPLPSPVSHAGEVFEVVDPIVAPGGNGVRSEQLVAGDFLGCDGRYWYKVTRSDTPAGNSFYPSFFDREFFRIAVNENMLKVDATLTLRFDIWARVIKQNSNAQWVVVVEAGTAAPQTTPAPVGPNLENIVWTATPILQQRILLTDTIVRHSFGVQVLRRVDDVLKTNKKIYGTVLAGDYVPTSPNFVLRGRLIEFDTENSVQNATGLAHYHFGMAGNADTIDPGGSPTVEITAGAAVAL